jgi:isoleucyl-tRNA synthetase
MISPIAPFYSDLLYRDLTQKNSVHLANFPTVENLFINKDLEAKMALAQKISSLVLRLRKKTQIKVRQPLQKVLIPSVDKTFQDAVSSVKDIIISEVNIKEVKFISSDDPLLKKKAKANFKVLGPKHGKNMKDIAKIIALWGDEEIHLFEKKEMSVISIKGEKITLFLEDVELVTADVPGWEIASSGSITVALDVSLNDDLIAEGLSRDFVNKLQNNRKEMGLEITDYIKIQVVTDEETKNAINNNLNYICSETLTESLVFVNQISGENLFEEDKIKYSINKLN